MPSPAKTKNIYLAPFDWLSFFQTFIYLLLVIIVLSFYLILRTTDDYLLQQQARLQNRLSVLENKFSLLESKVSGTSAAAAPFPSLGAAASLLTVEAWQKLAAVLLVGVKISEVEVLNSRQLKVSGQVSSQELLQRQIGLWQKIKEVSELTLQPLVTTGQPLNFALILVWQSSTLAP